MRVLGLETSGRSASVALVADGRCVTEKSLDGQARRHAQTLVAEIRTLLREADCPPTSLDGVAVSTGPGSFTGLRIGIVCAKTLAYAVGCRVAAVETFLAIAHNAPDDVREQFVIADAGRRELYLGQYRRESGGWSRFGELTIVPADDWAAYRQPDDVVTGPALTGYENDLSGRCRLLPPECWFPTAGQVALLGERLLDSGRESDPWTLQPLYLRKSAAEEKWDARHPGTAYNR